MVMEAEIHQQYGRESLGFNIFPSMLPLKNEKDAISAQVTVKMSLEKTNFTPADNRTALEVSAAAGNLWRKCVFFCFKWNFRQISVL